MNPNPYPQGRWTQVVASAAAARKNGRQRLMPESMASLVQAPLKELFWGIPESRLVEEARERLEHVLDVALHHEGASANARTVLQPELAIA